MFTNSISTSPSPPLCNIITLPKLNPPFEGATDGTAALGEDMLLLPAYVSTDRVVARRKIQGRPDDLEHALLEDTIRRPRGILRTSGRHRRSQSRG